MSWRSAPGVVTLWRSHAGTGRSMTRLLKTGGPLGILIDQDIESVESVFVPFFYRLAATPRGAADVALRADVRPAWRGRAGGSRPCR